MIEPPRSMRAKNVPATEARIATPPITSGADDLGGREVDGAEEHDRDERDCVGLEEVGRHAGTVAHVVADVVRDHGGIGAGRPRGIPGFDLADEVCADVGGLRVDAAAEPREDGDQRASEGKTDEVPGCGGLALVEPLDEDSVRRDPEQPEADDKRSPVTEPAEKATRSAGATPRFAASAVRTFARTATFIPMKPAAAEKTAPIRKPNAAPQPRSSQNPMTKKRTTATKAIVVLAAQIGGCSLLHGLGDRLHPLGSGRDGAAKASGGCR